MMIRRNHTLTKEFPLPKTEAGTDRMINPIQPAIDVLKSQAELTRLGKQYQVEVKLREYGRTDVHPCTFTPRWDCAMAALGIITQWGRSTSSGKRQCDAPGFAIAEHTNPDTRMHAGANPNFIAKQMGHTDAQMVYRVYGSWMAENNQDQVLILNQKLSEFAPSMPHAVGSDGN